MFIFEHFSDYSKIITFVTVVNKQVE